ncbi:MAG: hypothetical protein ACKVS9_17715 [Phycisphaerae bacterium]
MKPSLKNYALSALVVLNLGLLAGLVLQTWQPKPAFAQATGLSGNYLAVSGSIQSNFDALYVLDMQTKFLHGFIWDRGRRELEYIGNRQLDRDFRNN